MLFRSRLLYEALDDLFDYCFPILDKIAYKLDQIEDGLFEEIGRASCRERVSFLV